MAEPKFKIGQTVILWADDTRKKRWDDRVYEIESIETQKYAPKIAYKCKSDAPPGIWNPISAWETIMDLVEEEKGTSTKHDRCICSSIDLFAAGCTFDKTGVCKSVK